VYGLVKQYGGFIQVQSALGQGSRFDIYLPRHAEKPVQTLVSQPVLSAHAESVATILVVEDEPQVLLLVTALLRNLGYAVISAASPQAAIELVQASVVAPNLLLTDVVMPEMNGVELARALRTHHPGLKAMFMSGYVADARDNLAGDPSMLLYKPFTVKSLADAVAMALGGSTSPSTACRNW
jgi:CheY-like chemotaxis protein